MITEEQFLEKVKAVHGNEIEVIGRFKGTTNPILFKTKYGICQYPNARALYKEGITPTIKCALNKTEYFMAMLKEKYPEIAQTLTPQSEYEAMKKKMLFNTKFGLISINPDALMAGHMPNIRSAVNRKEYFKKQLEYLYEGYGYEFEISSTSRHEGRVKLICPIHGEQYVDTDGIFLGHGCPECNTGWTKSNIFYLVRLFNDDEEFYKLGVSYIDDKGNVRRFREYKKLGYGIQQLKLVEFEDFMQARDFELKMKHLIKNSIYMPNKWASNNTTECFNDEILPTILNEIKKEQDIVSTSNESQSSLNETEQD